MNELAIRELKAILGRAFELADPDDPDRDALLIASDDLDRELIKKNTERKTGKP
jgi:hypothetical protein